MKGERKRLIRVGRYSNGGGFDGRCDDVIMQLNHVNWRECDLASFRSALNKQTARIIAICAAAAALRALVRREKELLLRVTV